MQVKQGLPLAGECYIRPNGGPEECSCRNNLNKTSIGSKDDKLLLPPREEDDPDRLGFDGNYLKPKIESDI